MICKICVLFWVQDLQECRGRVAPKICADLVYFIQHKDRIFNPNAPKSLDDSPWHGAHIGTPVATNLCLVPYTTKGNPIEFAAQGLCNGSSQTGLSCARWPKEAEDRALGVGLELSHCQVFDDPALHLL